MPKRIAYLGIKSLPSQAGADRVVEAIIQTLDKDEYHPAVYCSSRVTSKDLKVPNTELIRIHTLPGKHLNALTLFLFSALHALLFGSYDLIHIHNVEAAFVLPLLRLRYKVITTSHGTAQTNGKWGRWAKFLICLTEYPYIFLSNCATSVSEPLATYYKHRYKREVYYLPNGVDLDNPIDQKAATEILKIEGIERGKYILFAAGRILPTKGCHFLLEAFRNIDNEIKLLVVGDTSHLPNYEQKLREIADDRVHFIPFISSKATLFGLVHAASLFIFPSTVEAMSMMLLEVASIGTPLICSDIPANVSILPNNILFFESENIEDLHKKLKIALEDPMIMQKTANAMKEWVRARYGWNDIVKQYEALYAGM